MAVAASAVAGAPIDPAGWVALLTGRGTRAFARVNLNRLPRLTAVPVPRPLHRVRRRLPAAVQEDRRSRVRASRAADRQAVVRARAAAAIAAAVEPQCRDRSSVHFRVVFSRAMD